MAKMTRKEMLEGRKCGLKYWDKALTISNRQSIIDTAIGLSLEFPNTWGKGWSNFDWALGNAVKDIACPKSEVSMTWNVDDVLTAEEMKYVASKLSFTESYKQCWPRK